MIGDRWFFNQRVVHMAKEYRLAELQLAIMQVLWSHGAATVGEVREALLPNRKLAYTTVGTMLAKMEEHGYVKHQSHGRQNIYEASIAEQQVSRSMVDDLVRRLFGGDVSQMVCQLLGNADVTPATIASLKKLIRKREQELRDE